MLAKKALFLLNTFEANKYNAKQLKKENKDDTNLYFHILLYFVSESSLKTSCEKTFTVKACNQYIPTGFLLLKVF